MPFVTKGDDDDGDCEQDQRFEMIVHRADQAGGRVADLIYHRLIHPTGVTWRKRLARTHFEVGRDRHESELRSLEKCGEGEDGEFRGHEKPALLIKEITPMANDVSDKRHKKAFSQIIFGSSQLRNGLSKFSAV